MKVRVISMLVFCFLVLSVSSMKWTEEDEVDLDADEFSTDTSSIKERFYEILDEIESFDPTPQIRGPCRARCLACIAVCRRTRITNALRRRCYEKCYRLRR